MKKILFITSRNIISTCGELRLIKNRTRVLKDEFGYTTDFIAYRIKKTKKTEDVGGHLTVFRNPFDGKKLRFMTRDAILSGEYCCVILSGNTINLAHYIKKIDQDCKIILDIHGTIEEYVEFRNHSLSEKMIFGCFYKYTKRVERKNVPFADGIIAVSHSLADHYKIISKKNDIKTFIVPCSTDDYISQKEFFKHRNHNRKKYNLSEDDIVFVYSGGASPWQCVSESVELFQMIRGKLGDNCKMLLFSGNKELLKKYKKYPGIITDSILPNEVMTTLCAGDFGIMLRENYATNNYAFPNKFLEYIGSGLRVIATPYVCDVSCYIKDYNLGFIVDMPLKDDEIEKICLGIEESYDTKNHFIRRDELIEKCSFKETLKGFDEFVGDD